jgi:hypothetical protein
MPSTPAPAAPAATSGEWLNTWWGGHRYPPFFTSHFRSRVKARRLEDGTVEAWWFDDDPKSRWPVRNQWHRIVQADLAERLYLQAVAEARGEVVHG